MAAFVRAATAAVVQLVFVFFKSLSVKSLSVESRLFESPFFESPSVERAVITSKRIGTPRVNRKFAAAQPR